MDKTLLFIVIGLVLFGLVMVYSASAMLAEHQHNNQYYYLIRQGIWAALGVLLMVVTIRIDYRYYKNSLVIWGLLLGSMALLVAVFMFHPVNGARRWVRFHEASFQPSEIAKVAVILFLAYLVERRTENGGSFNRIFAIAGGATLLMMGLIVAEPDLGTSLSIGLIFMVVMFVAGLPIRYLAMLSAVVVPAAALLLLLVPWRMQRLMVFLDPWKNQATTGFQTVQSLIAIGSGGPLGLGLAQGKQKLFYLPFPHTDFIFAVIGEELGLIGTIGVVLVFAALAWRGMRIARHAPDAFGQCIAVGITVMMAAQAFFNVSVALSLLPAKGIPLPLISCGGSSLAINLLAAGILLNVSKHSNEGWR